MDSKRLKRIIISFLLYGAVFAAVRTVFLALCLLFEGIGIYDVFIDFAILPLVLVFVYALKPIFGLKAGKYIFAANVIFFLIKGFSTLSGFISGGAADEEFYPFIFMFTVSSLILGFGLLTVKALKYEETPYQQRKGEAYGNERP